MSIIERAAQALNPEAFREDGPAYDGAVAHWARKHAREVARTVLAAIREPSEAMANATECGQDGGYGPYLPRAADEWQAMIDAALAEVEGT